LKKALRILITILITIIICAVIFIVYLTVTDYNPELELTLDFENNSETSASNTLSVMTWNIGYGGLGSKEDNFFDGGKNVNPLKENTTLYLKGIRDFIEDTEVDYYLFQEVDVDSKRSYYKNQYEMISNVLSNYSTTFAWNYCVDYVPYPWPTIGKVNACIATFSSSKIKTSTRIGFNANYDWPIRIVHLDRCLMITTHDIKDSDKQLVIINLHLSAYDDGSLRTVQLARLKEIMEEQYALGNYVIVGGDFNQTFGTANNDAYPVLYPEIYLPNNIPSDWLSEGWNFGFDDTVPTYRLLNEPYDITNTNQLGVIDGFITSPNIKINDVETVDLQFAYSDHQPVKITIQLK
jgi:endonuclease/exonuclease/phosphatase family metal-dependent hydrolase